MNWRPADNEFQPQITSFTGWTFFFTTLKNIGQKIGAMERKQSITIEMVKCVFSH